MHAAVVVAQHDVTDAQVLDDAGLARHFHRIADAQLVVDQQREAAQEVARNALGREADRDARDARRSQQWCNRDAELRQQQHRDDRDHDHVQRLLDGPHDGRDALLVLDVVGARHECPPDESQHLASNEPPETPKDEDRADSCPVDFRDHSA